MVTALGDLQTWVDFWAGPQYVIESPEPCINDILINRTFMFSYLHSCVDSVNHFNHSYSSLQVFEMYVLIVPSDLSKRSCMLQNY